MVTSYFLDTSALLKRYTWEVGSAWVNQVTTPTSGIALLLSEITMAELAAALAALHRAPKGITQQQRDETLSLFLGHCQTEYHLIGTNRHVVERAVALTQAHKLRGCDALQLAAALVANDALVAAGSLSLIFVAADYELLAAAREAGFSTENPTAHL